MVSWYYGIVVILRADILCPNDDLTDWTKNGERHRKPSDDFYIFNSSRPLPEKTLKRTFWASDHWCGCGAMIYGRILIVSVSRTRRRAFLSPGPAARCCSNAAGNVPWSNSIGKKICPVALMTRNKCNNDFIYSVAVEPGGPWRTREVFLVKHGKGSCQLPGNRLTGGPSRRSVVRGCCSLISAPDGETRETRAVNALSL